MGALRTLDGTDVGTPVPQLPEEGDYDREVARAGGDIRDANERGAARALARAASRLVAGRGVYRPKLACSAAGVPRGARWRARDVQALDVARYDAEPSGGDARG